VERNHSSYTWDSVALNHDTVASERTIDRITRRRRTT